MGNGATYHDEQGRMWAQGPNGGVLVDRRTVEFRTVVTRRIFLMVDGQTSAAYSPEDAAELLRRLREDEPSDFTVMAIKGLEAALAHPGLAAP